MQCHTGNPLGSLPLKNPDLSFVLRKDRNPSAGCIPIATSTEDPGAITSRSVRKKAAPPAGQQEGRSTRKEGEMKSIWRRFSISLC